MKMETADRERQYCKRASSFIVVFVLVLSLYSFAERYTHRQ
jgi:hypothetical protein